MIRFTVGDHVHLPGIGTGVVRDVRSGGRYVVQVKNATMVVTAAQMEAAEPRKKQRDSPRPETTRSTHDTAARAHAVSTIDLHGRTAIEAEAAVDEFVNAALLGGLSEVRIIHGRSGGRVKQAVHARLRQLTSVRAFRLDPSNPGVTVVQF